MCKCAETTDFKKALRSALAETTDTRKMAVWENNEKIYYGTVQQAETRMKKGTIECYFIPKRRDKEVTFKIMETPEAEPEPKTTEKTKAEKPSGK